MHFDWQSFVDWVQVVSAAGTVIAVGFAAWAIRQSSSQARESSELVVEERRRTVQIDALQRLADVIAAPQFNGEMAVQRQWQAAVHLGVIDRPMPCCEARWTDIAPNVSREAAKVLGVEGLIDDQQNPLYFDTFTNAAGHTVRQQMAQEVIDALLELRG